MKQIALDQAVTSSTKAPGVAQAVFDYLNGDTANIGRGSYVSENQTGLSVFDVREKVRSFFGGNEEDITVFTMNITQALNLALRGYLKKGDHVLLSGYEHHAITRTLDSIGCSYSILDSEKSIDDYICPETKAVVLTHASNVTGEIIPVESWFRQAKEKKLLTVLDTAQTAGHLPISKDDLHADILCFTGHKGLLGPQGVGGMLLNQETADLLEPVLTGGTGSHSESFKMPKELPDRFEAGTLNIPAIIGLGAAIEYLEENQQSINKKESELLHTFQDQVDSIPYLQIAGNPSADKVPVVSLIVSPEAPLSSEEASALLDEEYQITTRCGLHCAPLAHQTIGSYPEGTLRFSFGHSNSLEEVNQAISALKTLYGDEDERS